VNQIQRIAAVGCFEDDVAGCFEQFSHQLAAEKIIVCDQYRHYNGVRSATGGREQWNLGRVKWN